MAESPTRRRRSTRLTERDLVLLAFLAEHRLVLAAHVQALLGVSAAAAYGRLHALSSAGFVVQRQVFDRQPGCYRITRSGLGAVGRSYSAPRIDLSCYRHDVGVAWLWLAARSGVWGEMREVVSERRLRSVDAGADRPSPPAGVRLGGHGADGRERRHYPDLLLVTPGGRRIAVELELTSKGRTRREQILAGYAADARIDAVLYLTDSRAIAKTIQTSARRLDISHLIHVQPVRWGTGAGRGPDGRVIGRAGSRRVREAGR